MKLLSRKEFSDLFEWVSVLYIAFFMCVYGGAKYIQFGDINQYTKPLNSYQGMQLMWAFYSYSKAYAVIIGIFEIVGSILLIIPKTRIFGGFVLSAVLCNIILQDAFYGVHRGALFNAILYQIIILIIFCKHRKKILLSLSQITLSNTINLKKNFLKYFIIGILLFIVLYFIPIFFDNIFKFFNF